MHITTPETFLGESWGVFLLVVFKVLFLFTQFVEVYLLLLIIVSHEQYNCNDCKTVSAFI